MRPEPRSRATVSPRHLVGGIVFFGVHAPFNLIGFALSAAMATCVLFAMGLLICAVAPMAPVAGAMGTALLYPLMSFAGLWAPRTSMTPLLQTLGDFTPLRVAVQAMQSSMLGTFPTAGSGFWRPARSSMDSGGLTS
jgi:ABC-2 type transport system permease protein